MKKFFTTFILLILIMLFFPAAAAVGQPSVFIISTPQKNHTINLNKYKTQTTSFAILSSARRRIKGRTIKEKIQYANKLVQSGLDAQTAIKQVFAGIDKEFDKIIKETQRPPKNAQMFFDTKNHKFSFIKEQNGNKINKQELYNNFFNALINNKTKIEVNPKYAAATLTVDMLKNATFLRAGFQTDYYNSSIGRKHNVRLALTKIDGKIIYPGEIFSFNQATGKRNDKAGYRKSKVMVKGSLVDGYGGGVCQVSTMLYNAAILSGLDIIDSRGHSAPVSYVPPGLDAMVSEGASDLIIKNNLSLPIAIKAKCNGKIAYVEIYGQDMGNVYYDVSTELLKNLEPAAPVFKKVAGKKRGTIVNKGFDGFVVQSFRHKIVGDELAETERLRKTSYDSVPQIIAE